VRIETRIIVRGVDAILITPHQTIA
jgi:hypothetical protein